MFKILRALILIVMILIIALAAVGFFLPTDYNVSRSIIIDAPPGRVERHVGDLKKWASDQDGMENPVFFEEGGISSASAVYCSVVEGDKTKVEWRMAGDMDIPVFGGYLVYSMDAAAGPIFERGLEKLKGTVEDVNR